MMSMARALILGSAFFVLGCEDESGEQCIVTSVSYAGSAVGTVYLVGEAADGSGQVAEKSPSIAVYRGSEGESCSDGEISKVAWTFRAWIDVTGTAEQRCAAVFNPRLSGMPSDAAEEPDGDAGLEASDCAPLPDDPQVTVTRTLGAGRSRIDLEIADR